VIWFTQRNKAVAVFELAKIFLNRNIASNVIIFREVCYYTIMCVVNFLAPVTVVFLPTNSKSPEVLYRVSLL